VIVLDASVVLEVLLQTPLGLRHAGRLFGEERHAPHVLDLEFAQALRRLTLSGEFAGERARLAFDIYADLTFVRHPHDALLQRIWELRFSVSAYDAAYLALAEGLEAPLLTCDAKLSRSHGHRAKVVLLA
jgi:predicted nucleic acid-binding protein